jgi:hypothetical protein
MFRISLSITSIKEKWVKNLILFPPFVSDILMSLVSIGYGIRWERYYTAWISVVLNVIFTAVFLGSNDLPIVVIAILLLYVALGISVAKRGIDWLYPLFGTKTFGALTLTACFSTVGFLNWASFVSDKILGYDNNTTTFLTSWILIGLTVHLFGWLLFGKNNRTNSKKKT